MRRPEAALQRTIISYLRWALPRNAWFTAIAHGSRGGGDAAWLRGAIWKGMGARPGVPDLLIVWKGRAHFAELKASGGALSPAQRECHAELEAAGCAVATWRSLEDAHASLMAWGIPLHVQPSVMRGLAADLAAQGRLSSTGAPVGASDPRCSSSTDRADTSVQASRSRRPRQGSGASGRGRTGAAIVR